MSNRYYLKKFTINCYNDGNIETAEKLANILIDKKDSDGYWILANINYDKDKKKYIKLLRCGAKLNSSRCLGQLGDMYYNGIYLEQDYKMAVKYYNKAYLLENYDICNNLGNCYYNGWGIEQSYFNAKIMYIKGYKNGNISAMNNLAYMCLYDTSDTELGIRLYRESIELGSKSAINNLAHWYLNNNQPKETLRILRHGCRLHKKDSQLLYALGYYYYLNGDYKKSIRVLTKSIKLNNSNSLYLMAQFYLNGKCGLRKSKKKALNLLSLGAKLKHLQSEELLLNIKATTNYIDKYNINTYNLGKLPILKNK